MDNKNGNRVNEIPSGKGSLEKILAILEESGADGWEVADLFRECWEFYFIGHRLDQNRCRQVEHTNVKVYRKSEDGRFLGSASGEIHPTASEEEIRKQIGRLTEQASLVRNPYFELRRPEPGDDSGQDLPEQEAFSPEETAADFIRALREIPETETEFINSYEIFVSDVRRHLVTSTGVDVTSRYPHSMTEVVVNARKRPEAGSDEPEEIELYRMYTSGRCDRETLRRSISETLAYGRDRLRTSPTPQAGKTALLLSTDAAVQVYDYFIERMNAAAVYQKISDWKPGDRVTGGSGETGGLTIRGVRYLENSSSNLTFDPEGARIHDTVIIRDGVAENYWGSRQFAQYLGLEDCFLIGNFLVEGGVRSAEELRSGKYLEVVEFSDFQVNSMTGDIAGEIRLGYWHDGEETLIVSGGSVSGNMRELEDGLSFSRETRQYDSIVIPAVTRLESVSVTGAENGSVGVD